MRPKLSARRHIPAANSLPRLWKSARPRGLKPGWGGYLCPCLRCPRALPAWAPLALVDGQPSPAARGTVRKNANLRNLRVLFTLSQLLPCQHVLSNTICDDWLSILPLHRTQLAKPAQDSKSARFLTKHLKGRGRWP